MTRLTLPPDFCRRLLALPPDTRRVLAYVPGPGWRVYRNTSSGVPDCYVQTDSGGRPPSDLWVWWPANPAAAVAAICVAPGLALQVAHELLAMRMGDTAEDDHAAALGLIEAHLRRQP